MPLFFAAEGAVGLERGTDGAADLAFAVELAYEGGAADLALAEGAVAVELVYEGGAAGDLALAGGAAANDGPGNTGAGSGTETGAGAGLGDTSTGAGLATGSTGMYSALAPAVGAGSRMMGRLVGVVDAAIASKPS